MSISDPRHFSTNPDGTVEWFHYDPHTDGFIIETVQDVEPLFEQNKALYNDAPTRFGELTHVASLPAVIVMELTKQQILGPGGAVLDEPRFKRWLNDSDNRLWRTHPARV